VAKRVLIIPKGYFGDIVLTSPVFETLKRSSPEMHVTALIPEQFVEFVKRDPYVDETLVFDRRGEFAGWNGLNRFAEKLRAKNFDVAYSFHRSPRTSLLLWRAGIPERVGYADSLLAFLYTRRVRKTPHFHEVVRNVELIQQDLSQEVQEEVATLTRSGPVPVSNFFSLRVPDVSLDEVSATINGYLAVQQPFVVISPSSAWETKRWSTRGFREVAAALVAQGYRVVVIGAPDDSTVCGEVCRELNVSEGAVVNLCGRTTMLELIYLIRHAKAVICNDSLALHIASATRVPTVAVFCATSPLFGFGPWKNRAIVVEKSDLFCKPCRRHGSRRCPTGTNACIDGVSSGEVLRAFDALALDESKRRSGSTSLHVV
jgi:heptosyltransferase-2